VTGPVGTSSYDLNGTFIGIPVANEIVMQLLIPRAINLLKSGDFIVRGSTNTTNAANFNVFRKVASNSYSSPEVIGSASINAGSVSGSFTWNEGFDGALAAGTIFGVSATNTNFIDLLIGIRGIV
jgi:hypothetical protein